MPLKLKSLKECCSDQTRLIKVVTVVNISKSKKMNLYHRYLIEVDNYSGDLNTGLVWYSSGQKLSDRRIVWYSNAIWIPVTRHLNTGQVKVRYSDASIIRSPLYLWICTCHIKLDPKEESDVMAFVSLAISCSGPGYRSDLFPNQLLWIEPPHDVRRVALRHGPSRIVEHEAEVFSFSNLEVVKDKVEYGWTFWLLVHVEGLVGVIKKCHLQICHYGRKFDCAVETKVPHTWISETSEYWAFYYPV